MNWFEDWGFPGTLSLGHKTIRVIVRPLGEMADDEYGSSIVYHQTIQLDGSMTREKAGETLLHEIRHLLWDEWGMGSKETEERVITVMTRAECWAAAQNPEAFRWIYRAIGVFPERQDAA